MTTNDHSGGTASSASPAGHPPRYEIRVKGRLGPRWTSWFDGLCLTGQDDGTTLIHGPLADQAALHGVLQKLRDVGIPLVSLTEVPVDDPAPAHRTHEGN